MQATIDRWTAEAGWGAERSGTIALDPQLILCFASKRALAMDGLYSLVSRYPNAIVASCSTGGEIDGLDVLDHCASAALVRFEHTTLATAHADVTGDEDSFGVGLTLAAQLARADLRCVLVLSDGLHVNGAKLVEGMRTRLGEEVMVAGGLAGDGADFGETLVGFGDAPRSKQVVAIGLYGARLSVGSSSHGGWDSFGPERHITRARGPVVYELDGQPALSLYKRYLGEEAANLPASALLFPLSIRESRESPETLTRTIVGIDEDAQSMTFAGEMPEGWIAQLMRGVTDRLVDGAGRAALAAHEGEMASGATLGLMFSCIGRKLMMGQRVQEEVEAVCAAWPGVAAAGFYSYGEIGPHGFTGRTTLHNQTMTTLLLGER
jgi:hypothetical protein